MADELREVLGVPDLDPELLRHALTHRSYAYENGSIPNNERLEFLGDAVLGFVVTETIFARYPDFPEGELAKLRSSVVSARALADVARSLGLGEHLLLGRGEENTGGREKGSILSDTMEAVLGAIFVQFGMERVAEVIHRIFDPLIGDASVLGAGLDWKTSLQEIAARNGLGEVEYLLESTGPDHDRTFVARARVAGTIYEKGVGSSKRDAERMVAEIAWRSINAELSDAGAS